MFKKKPQEKQYRLTIVFKSNNPNLNQYGTNDYCKQLLNDIFQKLALGSNFKNESMFILKDDFSCAFITWDK